MWIAFALIVAFVVVYLGSRWMTPPAAKVATANDSAEKAIVVDFAARKKAEAERIDAESKTELQNDANKLPPGAA